MSEIRTTKIDGQEFVPYKNYLRLKEENKAVGIVNDELRRINEKIREENQKLQEEIKKHKQNIMQDELEIIPKLEEENQKLKEKLEQIKETYIRFEDSEREYNKGLGELDQLIMNR